ncbi:sensor histidine kinase [Kordia algicida OT-1]|uniref:Oxygen sensor histidine kinase NreB n=1 Tax=Kordia algicida OT-1 TaxID=391587 RepID=A9ECH3_9FLAO|nr:sensor histidine kinase [Kordia algicida]EDP94364.1 putative transmembrane protein [Kordia algicida OT-1]
MKLLLHTKKLILPAIFLIVGFCVSQNTSLDILRNSISKLDLDESKSYLKSIDTTVLDKYDRGLWYFYNGLNHRSDDNHDKGFQNLLRAEELFQELDSINNAADTNYEIHILLSHQNNLDIDSKPYLDKYFNYAKSKKDTLMLAKAYSRIAVDYMGKKDFSNSKLYFDKTLEQLKLIKDTFRIAAIEMNIGTLYYSVKNNADSSLYYFKKSLPTFVRHSNTDYISYNYNNQAKSYELKKDYKKAIDFYKKADSITLKKYNAKTKVIFYDNMAEAYNNLKDYENAALYLNKSIELKDSINDIAQNIAINETNNKYKTEELTDERDRLEKLNIIIEAENKQTNSLLIISLSILTLVIISAYLLQKNTRKKQLLAEQAKDLEAQKVENLLQEQELASIDAMIEGQEKERKRIAEDLHDDLGALMATINLHLENIGSKNSPNALNKTKTLLGEAYEKIRNISHIKNAGVIANQGLLVAINNMTSKIKSANKLDIEVIAHGLENRLENSLELSLFRMIQELIANIIKHAEATKATIQLTQYEKNLNIIVEDNGKGFDTTIIKEVKETGIGLENIKKRIIHLEGTFAIDSTIGKGTTILIDIPLTV